MISRQVSGEILALDQLRLTDDAARRYAEALQFQGTLRALRVERTEISEAGLDPRVAKLAQRPSSPKRGGSAEPIVRVTSALETVPGTGCLHQGWEGYVYDFALRCCNSLRRS